MILFCRIYDCIILTDVRIAGCYVGDQVRVLQDGQAGPAAPQVLCGGQSGAHRTPRGPQHEPGQSSFKGQCHEISYI